MKTRLLTMASLLLSTSGTVANPAEGAATFGKAATLAVPFPEATEQPPALTPEKLRAGIRVEGESFARGRYLSTTDEWTKGVAVDDIAHGSFVAYDFEVPGSGWYEFWASYACNAFRPMKVCFDDRLFFPSALTTRTGGWLPEQFQWTREGHVYLAAGKHTMTVLPAAPEIWFSTLDAFLFVPASGLSRPCFRKVANLPGPPAQATLTSLGNPYTLFINGQAIPAEEWEHDITTICRLDIRKYLRPGRNVIGLSVDAFGPEQGLALQAGIWAASGEFTLVKTDSSWKVSSAEEPQWTSTDFDDSSWSNTEPSTKARQSLPSGFVAEPPYVGPINLQLPGKEPIFMAGKAPGIRIGVPKGDCRLVARMKDCYTGRETSVDLLRQGNTFAWKDPLTAPGAYELILTLRSKDGLVDERSSEIVVVGRILQPELRAEEFATHMRLTLVDEIDCTDAQDPHPFYDAASTLSNHSRVISTSVGQYRETPEGNSSSISSSDSDTWISWKFHINTPYAPHLVTVTYPDDGDRTMSVAVVENDTRFRVSDGNFNYRRQRGATCAYTGFPYPVSNESRTLQFVYFPNLAEACIAIATNHPGKRAAVSKVRVYEIGELPALKIPACNGRSLGVHSERMDIALFNYYTGPEGAKFLADTHQRSTSTFYRNWYKTFENQIKYMRFTGQNTYLIGTYMYFRSYFPGVDSVGRLKVASGEVSKDAIGLLARMFEANDMSLILGVEFMTTPELKAQEAVITGQDVANRKLSFAQVSKDGARASSYGTVTLNPLQPAVQKEMTDIVDTLGNLYKSYPAVKGIGFIVMPEAWQPTVFVPVGGTNNLEFSYDDYTISLFEKETGVKVPGAHEDPKRFGARYDFLTTTAREQWLAFRCRKLRDVNRKIRDHILAANPNWKYYLFLGDWDSAAMQFGWKQRGAEVEEILRERAMDPSLYRNERGIVLIREYGPNGARKHVLHRRPESGAVLDFNLTDRVHSIHKGDSDGAYIGHTFFEPDLTPRKGEWAWEGIVSICPQDTAGGRYILDDFATILSKSTPPFLLFAWCDTGLYQGHEDMLREFAAAYYSLPQGAYRTRRGKGFDTNITLREATVGNEVYFYVVNLLPWDLTVDLEFRGGVIEDLSGKEKRARSPLTLKLQPYQIRAFKRAPRTELTSGRTVAARAAVLWLKSRLVELEALAPPNKESRFAGRLQEARAAFERGDLAQARYILLGYDIRRESGRLNVLWPCFSGDGVQLASVRPRFRAAPTSPQPEQQRIRQRQRQR